MRTSFYIGIAVAAVTLAGCTVGPNYKRPQVAVPQSFRAPEPLPESQGASLADLKWFEVFRDPQLDDLIKVALVQNYDLRDAVARVDEARANLGITRSNQYPQVSASGDLQFTRLSRDGQFPLPASFVPNQNRNWGEAALNLLSFQVDLWGQLRRATEAARANLLNADWNRKTVITTVVSQVATDYFQLLELDSELRISQSTLADATGISQTDAGSRSARYRHRTRRASGRATRRQRSREHSAVEAADRTDRGPDISAARQEPGKHRASAPFQRGVSSAGGARRTALGIARTTPRHPRRRAGDDRG